MIYRDATLDDVDKIVDCICEDFDERNKDKNVIDAFLYERPATKKFIKKLVRRKYRYFCVCEKDGEIIGGQASVIQENPFRKDLYLSDIVWFTSPRLSKFKRLMVAYNVIKSIPSFMKDHNLSLVKGDLHSMDGVDFPSAAEKLLKKIGYQLMFKQYFKAI